MLPTATFPKQALELKFQNDVHQESHAWMLLELGTQCSAVDHRAYLTLVCKVKAALTSKHSNTACICFYTRRSLFLRYWEKN